MPDMGARISTPDGKGKVVGMNMLERVMQVELAEQQRVLDYTLEEIQQMQKTKCNGLNNEVMYVKDRNFLDTVMEFEQQLESLQGQFHALKEFVALMMEEHQSLQQENFLLRTRLDEIHAAEEEVLKQIRTECEKIKPA